MIPIPKFRFPILTFTASKSIPTKWFWHPSSKSEAILLLTIPKLNIDPENWWLEDFFPFGMVYFQGLCWTSRGYYFTFTTLDLPCITEKGGEFLKTPLIFNGFWYRLSSTRGPFMKPTQNYALFLRGQFHENDHFICCISLISPHLSQSNWMTGWWLNQPIWKRWVQNGFIFPK